MQAKYADDLLVSHHFVIFVLPHSYEELFKLAMIATVFIRESISEYKLPEMPEPDKNVYRIPVGIPCTTASSMDEDA